MYLGLDYYLVQYTPQDLTTQSRRLRTNRLQMTRK